MNDDYSFFTSSSLSRGLRNINRRGFIRSTGSLVALGSLPAYLNADPTLITAGINRLVQHAGVVLYREEDNHCGAFAAVLAQTGLQAVALSDDPVRQWRDGAFELKDHSKGSSSLIGLTNWPDLLLISGMATEQRKHVIVQMQHHVNDAADARWSAELAAGYLQLPEDADKSMLEAFARTHTHHHSVQPSERTLFSWLIA